MPNIYCLARNCTYNNDLYCCLDRVKVGGRNAQTSPNTCCESYIRAHSTMKLGTDPCEYTDIDCEAERCVHNCGGHCEAGTISVSTCTADGNVCNCDETECATFKKPQKKKS
ncbi:MAG: DUF1540 domain-containing protein [Eubacteriales bacterium]